MSGEMELFSDINAPEARVQNDAKRTEGNGNDCGKK
jgi:hypothetical protein